MATLSYGAGPSAGYSPIASSRGGVPVMATLSENSEAIARPSARRRPTMRDVATLAGVSLKTVSRVVNREPGVSEALAGRVQQAVEQLDYRPDFTASNLRRADRRTATIGLMVEDVANEYSSAVHAGVEQAARERGIAVLTASIADDPDRERNMLRAFASRRVDGLVVVPSSTGQSAIWNEREVGVPLVFVDRAPRGIAADKVLTNNREGARFGVEHLIARGYRYVAFLGGVAALDTAQERYDGYVDALSAAGIAIRPEWIVRDLRSPEEARAAAADFMAREERPDAIFSAQNLITMGTFRALRYADLHHSVGLLGYDDFALADLLDPAVSVIAQEPRAIGFEAAELLVDRIREEQAGESAQPADRQPVRRVIPSRLVVRDSTPPVAKPPTSPRPE